MATCSFVDLSQYNMYLSSNLLPNVHLIVYSSLGM